MVDTNVQIFSYRIQADWIYTADDNVECATQEVTKVFHTFLAINSHLSIKISYS